MSDEPVSLFLIGSFAKDQISSMTTSIVHDVNGYNLP